MDDIRIERIKPRDEELLEEWVRITGEKDILGVCAARMSQSDWPWQVSIYVAEFIRSEPLQSELFDAITSALSGVPGVARAVQEDREVWAVQGNVAGDALVRACSLALNRLAQPLRDAYAAL